METGPVYFIGGSFGGAALSPSVTAVLGAVVGAGGALLAAWLMENYKRHLDRKSLAAAFLSEITLLIDALEQEIPIYKGLLEAISLERPVPRFIGTTLVFRVSIYEKCANQIGQLGPQEAAGLVRFHGFIDGLRDEGRRSA